MKLPSLLLFDLGGVIIESATFSRLNELLPEPLPDHSLKQRWLSSPAVRAFELGQISALEFAKAFIQEWQLNLSSEAFLAEFSAWPRDFYPEAVSTLSQLRQNYQLGCLSNSNQVHWAKFGGFTEYFDHTFFSHLMGVIKPDPEAFLAALEQCQVPAEEIYYFDDSMANIQTARQLGMQAFLVQGFNDVQQLLRYQGLLEA